MTRHRSLMRVWNRAHPTSRSCLSVVQRIANLRSPISLMAPPSSARARNAYCRSSGGTCSGKSTVNDACMWLTTFIQTNGSETPACAWRHNATHHTARIAANAQAVQGFMRLREPVARDGIAAGAGGITGEAQKPGDSAAGVPSRTRTFSKSTAVSASARGAAAQAGAASAPGTQMCRLAASPRLGRPAGHRRRSRCARPKPRRLAVRRHGSHRTLSITASWP